MRGSSLCRRRDSRSTIRHSCVQNKCCKIVLDHSEKGAEVLHSNNPGAQGKLKSWPPFWVLLFELMCMLTVISNGVSCRVIPKSAFNISQRATFGFHGLEINVKIYRIRFV